MPKNSATCASPSSPAAHAGADRRFLLSHPCSDARNMPRMPRSAVSPTSWFCSAKYTRCFGCANVFATRCRALRKLMW